jgi:hypothetical protein
MVALMLFAILFTGLAAVLGDSLKTLGISRGRGQANEIATQGIEDLQRFNFSSLVLCDTPVVPPKGNVPSGFTTLTLVMGTCGATPNYETPCPLPTTTGMSAYPVPKANYICNRFGIGFIVRRYIAWADASQAIKRLAVVVDWIDQAGNHEVSQQSSVRAPDQASIIGATPPQLTSASTLPTMVWVDASGHLVTSTGAPQTINLQANASGLSSTDAVNAYFMTEDPTTHVQTTATIPLISATGATWLGAIPGAGTAGAPTFPTAGGTEYIGYTAVRKSDGKANSILSTPAITFCNNPSPSNTAGVCQIASAAPSISTVSLTPLTVGLNPDGSLQVASTLVIAVVTTNLQASTGLSDAVTAVLQTQAGASPVQLKPTCALTSSLTTCNTWSITIDSTLALKFPGGPEYVYITANQVASAAGSSAAAQSTQQVDFQ